MILQFSYYHRGLFLIRNNNLMGSLYIWETGKQAKRSKNQIEIYIPRK